MAATASEQIIRDYFECVSTQGVGAATRRYVSPDVVWWTIGFGEVQDKLALFGALFEQNLADGPGLKMTVLDMISEGDKVAAQAEGYGKLKDGAVYNNFYHFLFEIRDGKIQRTREYLDTRHVDQVLGPYIAQMS